ncbi:MAG: hypothetical protein Q7S65_05230 [Nanoarchaeota archaeon]|nr:hypothetical protein [Nanoarchaeota archaeon]
MRSKSLVFLIFSLALIPAALADIGIPIVAVNLSWMILLFIPIVLLEAYIVSRYIKAKYTKTLIPVTVANLVTTLLGYPFTWALLFGFEMLMTGGSCGPGFWSIGASIKTFFYELAWMCPWDQNILNWTYPLTIFVGLVFAFFVSVYIERIILKRFFKDKKKEVHKAVWISNLASYALLLIAGAFLAGFVFNMLMSLF